MTQRRDAASEMIGRTVARSGVVIRGEFNSPLWVKEALKISSIAWKRRWKIEVENNLSTVTKILKEKYTHHTIEIKAYGFRTDAIIGMK